MSNNDNCPDFNGYNTQICRDQGHSPKFKTKAMYMPLIDMTPSEPDTIMTALHEAQQIASDRGQDYFVLFVCFVALRPKPTAMVIAGRSVHLNTLFPGQA